MLPVRGDAPGRRGRDDGSGLGTAADGWSQRSPRLGGMTVRMAPGASGKTREHGSVIDSPSRCRKRGCARVS